MTNRYVHIRQLCRADQLRLGDRMTGRPARDSSAKIQLELVSIIHKRDQAKPTVMLTWQLPDLTAYDIEVHPSHLVEISARWR